MPWRHDPDASIRGAVLLGQVAEPLPVLEVACNRCDRRGRLRTARLVAQHGTQMPLSLNCCVSSPQPHCRPVA